MKKNILKLFTIILVVTFAKTIDVYATPANPSFKDDKFYKCVLSSYNSSLPETYNLTDQELASIRGLFCESSDLSGAVDTTGIEKLTSLDYIGLDGEFSSLDLSKNEKLTEAFISSKKMTEINLTNNKLLTRIQLLNCNKLENLDLTNNTKLEDAWLYDLDNVKSLDLSKNTELSYIIITDNKYMKSLDLTNNTKLEKILISNTKISELDLTKNTLLTTLEVPNNKIKNLDLTNNLQITYLNISGNNLLSQDLLQLKELKDNESLFIDSDNKVGDQKEKNQSFDIEAKDDDGVYTINLKDYDSKLDPSKVEFTSTNNVEYDNETGIFTLTKLQSKIQYSYKLTNDIDMKVELKISNYQDDKNENDNQTTKTSNVPYAIFFITSLSILISVIIVKLVKRNKNI